jgi:molybdate transport system substrate-binding protein
MDWAAGMRHLKTVQVALLVATALAGNSASAADISIVSTVAVRGLIERVRRDFEGVSGDHVNVKYGTSATLQRQMDEGEPFDVAILTPALLDDLAERGKVERDTFAMIAKSGIGIAVKAGASRPKIGTRAELRNALLGSDIVAYTEQGQSGAAIARLFDLLDISQAMARRTYLDPRPGGGLLAVAEGKASLAFALLSEIAANSQVELVAPLPEDLQSYVVFAAGAASATNEPRACRDFIAFLRTPPVLRALSKYGMIAVSQGRTGSK